MLLRASLKSILAGLILSIGLQFTGIQSASAQIVGSGQNDGRVCPFDIENLNQSGEQIQRSALVENPLTGKLERQEVTIRGGWAPVTTLSSESEAFGYAQAIGRLDFLLGNR